MFITLEQPLLKKQQPETRRISKNVQMQTFNYTQQDENSALLEDVPLTTKKFLRYTNEIEAYFNTFPSFNPDHWTIFSWRLFICFISIQQNLNIFDQNFNLENPKILVFQYNNQFKLQLKKFWILITLSIYYYIIQKFGILIHILIQNKIPMYTKCVILCTQLNQNMDKNPKFWDFGQIIKYILKIFQNPKFWDFIIIQSNQANIIYIKIQKFRIFIQCQRFYLFCAQKMLLSFQCKNLIVFWEANRNLQCPLWLIFQRIIY